MNEEECHICKEKTDPLAGNPSKWPMHLPYVGGNGKQRTYHTGCVIKAINYFENETDERARTTDKKT